MRHALWGTLCLSNRECLKHELYTSVLCCESGEHAATAPFSGFLRCAQVSHRSPVLPLLPRARCCVLPVCQAVLETSVTTACNRDRHSAGRCRLLRALHRLHCACRSVSKAVECSEAFERRFALMRPVK